MVKGDLATQKYRNAFVQEQVKSIRVFYLEKEAVTIMTVI